MHWQDKSIRMSNLSCNEGPFLVDKIKLFDGLIHTEPPDKLCNVPHFLVCVLHIVPHVTNICRPVLAVWFPHPLIVRRPIEKSSCTFDSRFLVPFPKPEQNVEAKSCFHHCLPPANK